MNAARTMLIAAASLITAVAGAQAQTSNNSTTSSQSEMNRGVPDVDVNVGRNADGAIDVNRANTDRAKGVPGVDADVGRNARGAVDVDTGRNATQDAGSDTASPAATTARPARADRG